MKDSEFVAIENLVDSDRHREQRRVGSGYVVQIITLYDMLQYAVAPNIEDLMPIDTAGSELDIPKAFESKN